MTPVTPNLDPAAEGSVDKSETITSDASTAETAEVAAPVADAPAAPAEQAAPVPVEKIAPAPSGSVEDRLAKMETDFAKLLTVLDKHGVNLPS